MGSEQAHSRLIANAAKDALGPLGIRRKGRSRIWLDDQGWWLGLIEFQPSSWSKGSYLNVGVMWLWDELPHLAYDVGYRVSGFERYEDRAKFEISAQNLAKKAAQEAVQYRGLFASPSAAADYYATLGEQVPGSLLPAGIALGVVGRSGESRKRFDAFLAVNDDRDWALEKKDRARGLRVLLDDHRAFLTSVRGSIAKTRELLRLPPLANWPL